MPTNIMQMLLQSLFGQVGQDEGWARREDRSLPLGDGRGRRSRRPMVSLDQSVSGESVNQNPQQVEQFGPPRTFQEPSALGNVWKWLNSPMSKSTIPDLWKRLNSPIYRPTPAPWAYATMPQEPPYNFPNTWKPPAIPAFNLYGQQPDQPPVPPPDSQDRAGYAGLSPAEMMNLRYKYQSRPLGVGDIRITPLTGAETRTREDLAASSPMQHVAGQYGRLYGDRPPAMLDIYGRAVPRGVGGFDQGNWPGIMTNQRADAADWATKFPEGPRYMDRWTAIEQTRQVRKALQNQKQQAATLAMEDQLRTMEPRMAGTSRYLAERFASPGRTLTQNLSDQDAYNQAVARTYANFNQPSGKGQAWAGYTPAELQAARRKRRALARSFGISADSLPLENFMPVEQTAASGNPAWDALFAKSLT